MTTEKLSTLKIHKLTEEQYQRELEAGRIDPNALYLTPENYATTEYVNQKFDALVEELLGGAW